MTTHILAVDDSAVMRTLVKITLENLSKVSVDTAENLQEALLLCETQSYDILILDYMMPEGSGIELIQALDKLGLQQDTPIFILSSESSHEVKLQAQQNHVHAWIKKPFHPQMLLELIEKTIQALPPR